MIKIRFPTTLTLPEFGETMKIIPLDNSLKSKTAKVEAGNEVSIVNVFEGLTLENLPGKGHTFKFTIVGIANQRSADDAGPITIQTFIKGSNGTDYKVDYGKAEASFVAVTGNVV